jgi:hypothetical protein
MTAVYPRAEIEEAFHRYYKTGPANDRWDVMVREHLTEDCKYVEPLWGEFNGQDEIETWVLQCMKAFPECYAVLEWYVIDNNRVVFEAQNRRDNPEPGGEPIDFVSWQILEYGGDGRFSFVRDVYWMKEARNATMRYQELCEKYDPDHAQRRSRLHLIDGPEWARMDEGFEPEWLQRVDEIEAIRSPKQLKVGIRPA